MFDKLYFKINSKNCEMSSFLITGSSGFLGKHLVNSIEKNHKVLSRLVYNDTLCDTWVFCL